jgi:hypothetical protein
VINIGNITSPHWRGWLNPANAIRPIAIHLIALDTVFGHQWPSWGFIGVGFVAYRRKRQPRFPYGNKGRLNGGLTALYEITIDAGARSS